MLLGDKWDLRNRYLYVNASEKWKVQPNLDISANSSQAQDKHRTSTGQVQDKLRIDNVYISCLVNAIGNQELSLKNMMEALGLKGRDNFLTLYLNPSITAGYVRLLYPDSPRHPRQKYLLTVKGLAVYNESKQR